MKTVTFKLPAYWAAAIFNDDTTYLSDAESEKLDSVLEALQGEYEMFDVIDVSEDVEFSKYHDASAYGVLACDVCEYTVQVG